MEYLDITHPEWSKMWDELANDRINGGDPVCANLGDSWEYMGSSMDHHHFRHPCHPRTQSTEYAYIERARSAVSWAS
jgi:hypothetical protein